MGFRRGPNIVRDGLVFGYDADDRCRFYKGEPTTNYSYHQNPRIDTTYSSVDLSSYGGTMVVHHPGIIQPYNVNNNAISSIYYNGGVSDPTNQQHAYWIYDDVLKKPIVQMIDTNGSWQAKYFGCGMSTWNTYGMTTGSQYVISWMQWTTNVSKYAIAGVYSRRSDGIWNFWDGQAGATAANTLPYTWQKVYQIFEVSSNHDVTLGSESVYMYGMYGGYGTVRISDVQFEIKSHATQYSYLQNRSSTQSLIDLKRTSTIDLSNVSFDSTAHPYFDGTDDYIDTGYDLSWNNTNSVTIDLWVKPDIASQNAGIIGKPNPTWEWVIKHENTSLVFVYWDVNGSHSNGDVITLTNFFEANIWHNITLVWSHINNNIVIYKNGQLISTTGWANASLNQNRTENVYLGGNIYSWNVGYWLGTIKKVSFYDKALTVSDVLQNYNTLKYRFNI